MKTLNLVHKENSDISYEIIKFPDGELHLKLLEELDHKEDVKVVCRITSADDLFILMQVNDILERHGITWIIFIYYLMSMRMDRVISFSEAFSLKVVSSIIKDFSACQRFIYHAHSDAVWYYLRTHDLRCTHPESDSFSNYQLCFPDEGAHKRYSSTYGNSYPVLIGEKVRNKDTGKIESIIIKNPEEYKGIPIMVVDDLCDAGGTFLGIAKAIREIDANAKLEISVIHMVNRKGIDNLSSVYDKVYFTNSYRDWDDLPSNCIMCDIIDK